MKGQGVAEFAAFTVRDELSVMWYTAEWCGPCQRIKPLVEKLGATVDFYKVDVDDHGEIASRESINSVPQFHFFKSGKRVATLTGANPEVLEATVKEHSA
jgi:thioredoxin-like negative regulator of GroEL